MDKDQGSLGVFRGPAGMLERFFFDVPMPKLMSGEMHNNKFKAIKSLFSIGY